MDTKVDKRLDAIIQEGDERAEQAAALKGKAAVANAKLAYQRFLEVFYNERFAQLQAKGAKVQRPLWASTSTKNPAYSDVLYVETLIGPKTVNTMPPQTLKAFNDHGTVEVTIEDNMGEAAQVLESLESLGISLETVTSELEEEGVDSFSKSFESLLETIKTRKPKPV
jgi:transaldolase